MGEQRASQLSLSHRTSGLISMLRAAPIHRSTETRQKLRHVSFMINKNSKDKITIASVGVTPRTPLFEGKIPENQKTKISIRKGRLLLVNDQGFSQIPPT